VICEKIMNSNFRNDRTPRSTRWHRPGDGRRAFTLAELLVVIGTLGILAVVLLPAIASTQPAGAKAFQCLNNMRQMAIGWMLYAQDNHDRMVMNTDLYRSGGGKQGNPSWCQGIEDWSAQSINTNALALTTDSVALLASYTGHRYQIYHCPADVYASPIQAAQGWPYRVRSVSMSCALGAGGRAPEFPWAVKVQKTKISDLRDPNPSNIFVFLDEAPDSINDPIFYNNPDTTGALTGTSNGGNWISFPSSLHDGSSSFSFADSHAEIHKWRDAATLAKAQVKYTSISGSYNAPDDVAWISAHTPLP
jgi:hypothetical protein